MATIEGAQAHGIDSEVGSIEKGKQADIIFVDLDCLTMRHVMKKPFRNHVPNVVYSARGNEITQVMVDGKTLYKDKVFLTADKEKIVKESQLLSDKLLNLINSNDYEKTKNYELMKADKL